MSDRELLELAAKAAGLTVRWHDSGHYGPTLEIMEDEAGGSPWNPLTDDGDALRLAVGLSICVHPDIFEDDLCATSAKVFWRRACVEKHGDDKISATRRAIVRAAAEIEKGMNNVRNS